MNDNERLTLDDTQRVRVAAAVSIMPAGVRAKQEPRVPEATAIAIACDLYLVAFTMKPSVRQAGIRIADEAAERMGLNPANVRDFMLTMLAEVDAQLRSDDE